MRASARRLARGAIIISDIRTMGPRPSLSSPRVVRSFFSISLHHSLAHQRFTKRVTTGRSQGVREVLGNTSLGHPVGREVQTVYGSLPATPPSSPPKQLCANSLKVPALQRLHGIQILPQISQQCSLSTAAPSAKRPISNQAEQSTLSMRIKQTLRNLKDVPVPALALGLAGLIPFVGLATPFTDLLPLPIALYNVHAGAQAAYGAVIVTFVGAVHWGLAMADYRVPGKGVTSVTVAAFRYIWSVIPSLLAWPALLLNPVPQFSVLISSLLLALIVDTAFAKMKLVPLWFLSLRMPLTAISVLSMTSSLLIAAGAEV